MDCLTINFARHFEKHLRVKIPITQFNARNVSDALAMLQEDDFTYIVVDARNCEQANTNLAQLLATTPVSTHIIALVSASTVPDEEYWRAQGATLLYESSEEALLNQLSLTIIPTGN